MPDQVRHDGVRLSNCQVNILSLTSLIHERGYSNDIGLVLRKKFRKNMIDLDPGFRRGDDFLQDCQTEFV